MGQKVNPIGFRTGIMVGWKSRWYASKQEFADLLVEDQKIRDFVKNRKDKFGKALYPSIAKIEIERTRDEVKVVLFSARPGHADRPQGRAGRGVAEGAAGQDRPADQHQDRRNQSAGDWWPSWWPRTSASSWTSGPASAAR